MRQIDNMDSSEIETLRLKGMLTDPRRNINRKRVEIQMMRIDACDTLLDYIHDDIPHADQKPMTDQLNVIRGRLTDEMEDGLSE